MIKLMFYDADKPMPPAGWSEMMEFELKKACVKA
jgi:uncharacterized protein YbdZ (MbtH family)